MNAASTLNTLWLEGEREICCDECCTKVKSVPGTLPGEWICVLRTIDGGLVRRFFCGDSCIGIHMEKCLRVVDIP